MPTREDETAKSPTTVMMFQFVDREIIVDETASKADLLRVIRYLTKELEGMRERQLRRLSIPVPYPPHWPSWIVGILDGE